MLSFMINSTKVAYKKQSINKTKRVWVVVSLKLKSCGGTNASNKNANGSECI